MKDGDILKQRVELKDGELYWREWDGMYRGHKWRVGSKVSTEVVEHGRSKKKYKVIRYTVDGKRRKAFVHRVIYFLSTGEELSGKQIDHINGDTLDNSITNLRAVTGKENQRNCGLSSNSSTGVNGVTKRNRAKPYLAKIMVDRKNISLGSYATLEEAAAARAEADKHYGFSGRHGASQ